MHITKYTDYGLRVLMYLASLPEGKIANVKDACEVCGIPRENLSKVIHRLGKEDVIETRRGRGGGFYLKKPPNEIKVGDIVMLLENNLEVVRCPSPHCCFLPECEFKEVFEQAVESFFASLNNVTLADFFRIKMTILI